MVRYVAGMFLALVVLGASCVGYAGSLIDVTGIGYGAVPDAVWGLKNCTLASAAHTVTCATGSYLTAPPPTGSVVTKVIIDPIGTSSTAGIPFVASIISVITSGTTQTITFGGTPPTGASIMNTVTYLNQDSGGSGYMFTSSMTTPDSVQYMCPSASACTGSGPYIEGTPNIMTAKFAYPDVAGPGGVPSATCMVTAQNQTALGGQPTQFKVTTDASGAIAGTPTIAAAGFVTGDTNAYSATTGRYAEPVQGCNISGAVIYIAYSVVAETLLTTNSQWTSSPPCVGSAPSMPYATTDEAIGGGGGGKNLTYDCR